MDFPPLEFCTWNTRGLGKRDRRILVLDEIQRQGADVTFVQEVHATLAECEDPAGWLGPEYAGQYTAFLSRLCGILVRTGIFDNLQMNLSTDRCISVTATCAMDIPSAVERPPTRQIHLTCVYAPTKPVPRKDFFTENPLWNHFPRRLDIEDISQPARYDIVAGDFNDYPHLNDSQPPNLRDFTRNRHWRRHIGPLFASKGIFDPLREILTPRGHSDDQEEGDGDEDDNSSDIDDHDVSHTFFTRLQPCPPVQTRIDHILLSSTFGHLYEPSIQSYFCRHHTALSDHFPVFLRIQRKPEDLRQQSAAPQKPQRSWSLHPQWLEASAEVFYDKLTSFLKLQQRPGMVAQRTASMDDNKGWQRWQRYKQLVLEYTQLLTRTVPRYFAPGSDYETQWREEQEALDALVNEGLLGSSEYYAQYRRVKSLEELITVEQRCIHKDKLNAIQQIPCSALFRGSQRRRTTQIKSLNDSEGVNHTDQAKLLEIVHGFFTNLYKRVLPDYAAYNELVQGGRSMILTPSQCRQIRAPIDPDELYEAACKLNHKSMPGQDGLPTRFYYKFHKVLTELARYLSLVFCEGQEMEPNTPKLVVSLLPKKGLKFLLKNYRPVSLIDTKERLASKVLATRLNETRIAHAILPPNQTAYVSGRVIFDSILMVQLFISASALGLTKETQAIVFLDQEKAFDVFSQDIIRRTLRDYGMPSQVLQLLKKTWSGAEARYKVNGMLTEPVKIERGVLQGDPSSALLYCMGTQPILDYFSRKGICFHYDEGSRDDRPPQQCDTPAYADDWAVTVSAKNLELYLHGLDLANRAAGVRTNISKSVFLALPGRNSQPDEAWLETLPYESIDMEADFRYLGAYIRADGRPATASHIKLIEGSKKAMSVWQTLSVSWYGRVKLVNTFYLSRQWHALGAAGGIDTSVILTTLHQRLKKFIFNGNRALIRLSTIAMPYEYGGLGLLLPEHMLVALAGRDLARGLSQQNQMGKLFRICLEEQTRKIECDPMIWLQRAPKKWRAYKRVFQPLWSRYADAATRLNLRVCTKTNTINDLLLCSFSLPEFSTAPPLSVHHKKKVNDGRLFTWNDILCDEPSLSDSLILPLHTAMTRLQEASWLTEEARNKSKKAWESMHTCWQQIEEGLDENIKAALKKPITIRRPLRHWLVGRDCTHMQLPPNLLLADVPLQQYTTKAARRYLIEETHEKELLPSRHRIRTPRRTRRQRRGILDLESQSEHETEQVQGTQDTEPIESQLEPAPSIADPLGNLHRLTQARRFWRILASSRIAFKLYPDHYTSVFRAYHGCFPYLGLDGVSHICCKGERATHQHRLLTCCRATVAWNHLYTLAERMGIRGPQLSVGECTELFPNWLEESSITPYTRSIFKSQKVKEEQVKMLLITTHVHVLLQEMFKAATNESHAEEVTLNRIERVIREYPFIASRIDEHTFCLQRQLQPPPPQELEQEEEDIPGEDDFTIEVEDEGNGEASFWDLY